MHAVVKKCKFRSNRKAELADSVRKFLSGDKLAFLYNLACTWFTFFARWNSKLYIIPYSFTPDGELQVRSKGQLLVHYVVLSTMVMSMMQKLAIFCYGISSNDSGVKDISTFVCLVPFIYLFRPTDSCISGSVQHTEQLE